MRDHRITHDCPFCGEADHLAVSAHFERPIVENGKVRMASTAEEETEEVEGVTCYTCEAMAPLDVWNRTRTAADYAALRDFDDPPPGGAA